MLSRDKTCRYDFLFQVRFGLFGCHKSNLEPHVWYASFLKDFVLLCPFVCTTNFFAFQLDLVNVFEVFLPQLLLYPNPSDPLNGEAAALMMRDRAAYEQKVKGDIL